MTVLELIERLKAGIDTSKDNFVSIGLIKPSAVALVHELDTLVTRDAADFFFPKVECPPSPLTQDMLPFLNESGH